MDMFIEKIVKRRKSVTEMLGIAGIILLVFVISFFLILYVPSYALLLSLGLIYLAYYLISQWNIEFEYAITNGDMDIDKIINQRKRKRVFSVNAKNIEIMARISSDKYSGEIKACKNVKDFTSHMEGAQVWFIYVRQESNPAVILFEPTPQMVDSFFTFNPRKVDRN